MLPPIHTRAYTGTHVNVYFKNLEHRLCCGGCGHVVSTALGYIDVSHFYCMPSNLDLGVSRYGLSSLHMYSAVTRLNGAPELICFQRCLLITESFKAPGYYWYLNLGPRLHPLYGIGGVQFAISRVPVYTAISNFLSSYSQRFRVGVACN